MRMTVFHQLAHLCALISNWFSIGELFSFSKRDGFGENLSQIRTKSIFRNGERVICDEHLD